MSDDTGYRCAHVHAGTLIEQDHDYADLAAPLRFTEPPSCTCGWEDPATSGHYSPRFGGRPLPDGASNARVIARAAHMQAGTECLVYRWSRGCDGRVVARGCPVRGCRDIRAFCAAHGGDARAMRETVAHVAFAHAQVESGA